jgi:hypothetical protein
MSNSGLLDIVNHGIQDIYIISNPQITFFKKAFKRHTNFAKECIRVIPDGQPDFGSTFTVRVPGGYDLLHRITLEIDLPELTATGSDDEHYIRYIKNIGYNIIDYVELQIGESVVTRMSGEVMYLWSQLSSSANQLNTLDYMAKRNQQNGPTTLYIPLQFFFCRDIGNALPLVALQYHEVKLNIKLRPLSQLYNFGETRYYDLSYVSPNGAKYEFNLQNGSIFTPFIDGKKLYILDTSTNSEIELATITYSNPTTILLDNLITTEQRTRVYVKPTYTLVGTPELVETRVFLDVIYLDTIERTQFVRNKNIYLIEQIQQSETETIEQNETTYNIPITFNLAVKELIWIFQSNENQNQNDFTNFTNSPDVYYYEPSDIISELTFNYNARERFTPRTGEYFRVIQPYDYHTNQPFDQYIYCYSFCEEPENTQPTGHSNMSNIDKIYCNFTLENHRNGIFRMYGINYNLLRIENGMGGLAFAS